MSDRYREVYQPLKRVNPNLESVKIHQVDFKCCYHARGENQIMKEEEKKNIKTLKQSVCCRKMKKGLFIENQ